MRYIEACRYIFERRGQKWENHTSRYRGRDFVLTKQICLVLGKAVYPELTYTELSLLFDMDHSSVNHAEKTINDLTYHDKKLKDELRFIERYLREQRYKADLRRIEKIKSDEKFVRRLERIVSEMRLVAEAYCLMTNHKIISNESENQRGTTEVQGSDWRDDDDDRTGPEGDE